MRDDLKGRILFYKKNCYNASKNVAAMSDKNWYAYLDLGSQK